MKQAGQIVLFRFPLADLEKGKLTGSLICADVLAFTPTPTASVTPTPQKYSASLGLGVHTDLFLIP